MDASKGCEGSMKNTNFYNNAHLVVAAIRVLEYQKGRPPTVDEMCETLSVSLEQGHMLCRKLQDMCIVEVLEGSYGTRLFIRDHLKIEEIPKESRETGLEDAVRQFQDSRKGMAQKVASIQANRAEKKKNLFAELDKKLKGNK
jgi:hypothetical protein